MSLEKPYVAEKWESGDVVSLRDFVRISSMPKARGPWDSLNPGDVLVAQALFTDPLKKDDENKKVPVTKSRATSGSKKELFIKFTKKQGAREANFYWAASENELSNKPDVTASGVERFMLQLNLLTAISRFSTEDPVNDQKELLFKILQIGPESV